MRKIGIAPNYISKRRKIWQQPLFSPFLEELYEINFCKEEEATRAMKWWNGNSLGSSLQSTPVLKNTEDSSVNILGYCVPVNHDLEYCECENCLEFREFKAQKVLANRNRHRR